MSGVFIDEPYDLNKDKVYVMILHYFGNLRFYKLEDTEYTSIYICKLGGLTNEKRYILSTVLKDEHKVGKEKRLNTLHWISFQTRCLPENYKITEQHYAEKRDEPYSKNIICVTRTEQYTNYILQDKSYPIKITLLHTKRGKYEYPDTGTLASALETFRTVITFLE